ncbi:MAG: hypothetical protein ABI443_11785 [Chthoniobacterales bacterium]
MVEGINQNQNPRGYCVLTRSIFRLEGGDRLRYLNGQVSNDVSKASAGALIPACVLTAKGKLCGVIGIHATSDALILDVDSALRETLQARLERYIIADDVSLTDESDQTHLLHIIGGKMPSGITSRRFGVEGSDFFLSSNELSRVTEKLRGEGIEEISPEVLEFHRVRNGIPSWGHELDENTLPQEALLEQEAVDFHKGCYVGQEVVSRIKSVGRVNRLLTGFQANTPLKQGMEIFSEDNRSRPVGKITSVSPVFGLSKWIGIGYLKQGSDLPHSALLAIDPESGSQADIQMREFSTH